MQALILDLVTGRTAWSRHDVSAVQWTENNWSCDCNRALAFEDIADQQYGTCRGCVRYLVVDFRGDLQGVPVDDLRMEANRRYYRALQAQQSARET